MEVEKGEEVGAPKGELPKVEGKGEPIARGVVVPLVWREEDLDFLDIVGGELRALEGPGECGRRKVELELAKEADGVKEVLWR